MTFLRHPLLVSVPFLALSSCSAPPLQTGPSPPVVSLTFLTRQALGPVRMMPFPQYPAEALKKHIAGNVILSLMVDAKGNVFDVRVVSGPPELAQSAAEAVKNWHFRPPESMPAKARICFSFGVERCPGTESDSGFVSVASSLRDGKGLLLGAVDEDQWTMPDYPDADRKAGASGDLVLGLTINAKGNVTGVRVLNSLSPHLDKIAMATAYTWKFKVLKGDPAGLPDEFPLVLRYTATCYSDFDLPSGPVNLR